jgi:hypothetical protein
MAVHAYAYADGPEILAATFALASFDTSTSATCVSADTAPARRLWTATPVYPRLTSYKQCGKGKRTRTCLRRKTSPFVSQLVLIMPMEALLRIIHGTGGS